MHDRRLGFLRLGGALRMEVVYISLLLRFMSFTRVSRVLRRNLLRVQEIVHA